MSGYIFGKDFLGQTSCISGDQYCRDLLGYNSRYDSLYDSCECNYSIRIINARGFQPSASGISPERRVR